MKTLQSFEIAAVNGGLTDAEMSTGYMLGTSAFGGGASAALFNAYAASIAGMPVWGAMATAGVVGFGTGLGAMAGYYIYHVLND